MILPGRTVLFQKILRSVRSPSIQVQPCGIDLTLKSVLTWSSAGALDFSNTRRKMAETETLPFLDSVEGVKSPFPLIRPSSQAHDPPNSGSIYLPLGSYLVEFNETVDVPLDLMGQIFVRSSLFRSGALVHAGVMDSGYRGAVGALLQVANPHGLRLWKDARLAQIVFHHMTEKTEGYKGVYQGREVM
ncbi:deoxyuridine 5'-triphosphate nucleotidohydrolase [Hyaloscypha bicolor E]|uniref:Deoxyuridine 5'-triphosphate nucleotidohydrolase n=1 Tax=Hyaloscypha bicolor E TaxID=1095630 RepID=A0A2J6T3I7_9HELO|nr:deoxyuridine 5'-triphosphate nucleotidohydrolase [Hyaloscypha bicolor E]PMD57577.1 deoxyuridine 5'-triphosphate nucleotidohydrolase [Hyaloscypha bicolor E]